MDTRRDIAEAANHMLGRMKMEPLPQERIIRNVGQGLRHLVAGALQTEDAGRVEEGMKIYRVYYAQHLLDHSRLYPGALDLLEHFRDRKQAVITNKPNPYSREILTGLGVAGYFLEIVAGDSEYPKKPDPRALVSLMEKNRIAAEETLFIGDSAVDVETGRSAKVLTVVIRHGFSDEAEIQAAVPDVVIDDFKQLIQLAQRNGW